MRHGIHPTIVMTIHRHTIMQAKAAQVRLYKRSNFHSLDNISIERKFHLLQMRGTWQKVIAKKPRKWEATHVQTAKT